MQKGSPKGPKSHVFWSKIDPRASQGRFILRFLRFWGDSKKRRFLDVASVVKKSSNIESMENSFALITDNSTIGMEYALALKKPVVYINYSKKIHNLDYKKIDLIPLEETFQKTIGFNVDIHHIDTLPSVLENFKKNNYLSNDKLKAFEDKNLSHTGNSAVTAARYLSGF